MSVLDSLADRVISLLGLDFDASFTQEPFDRITAGLTLGVRPRPEQLPMLRDLGITHVVSCLEADVRPAVDFLDGVFETLFLPTRDGMYEDIGAHFPTFFDFVDRAGSDAQVLVHCEVGVSRSASLAIAQVMRSEQLRFYEAYERVRTRRVQVLPNVGFATALQRFEHELFQESPEGLSSLARYLKQVCNAPVEVEVLQEMLGRHDFDAVETIRGIFGEETPRVIQGVRR